MDPQALFQKFCAGSCTRIKAHNSGNSGKYLVGRENQHTLRLNGIKSEEEKGVYKWRPDFQFQGLVTLPWQITPKNLGCGGPDIKVKLGTSGIKGACETY